MRHPGEIIYSVLNHASVTGQMGGVSNIFPGQASPGTKPPMIIYTTNNTTPQNTKNGPSSLDIFEVQITFFHTDYGRLNNMAAAARALMDYRTELTVNGITAQLIYFKDESQSFEDDIMKDGTHTKTHLYEFRIKNN
tara:strand:- start:1708 stop:2118 length:411 start_codon:yes stop_codon:yes gene_type:complete